MRHCILVLSTLLAALLTAAEDPLFRIREGRQFGFINRSGVVVIAPQFSSVEEFHDGLARVYLGSQAGFIDRTGKLVIPAKYSTATSFDQGRAIVSAEGKYSIIDKQGKTVADIPHRVMAEFHDGLVVVQRARSTGPDGKQIPSAYGYVDRDGKMVIEPKFMPAGPFPDDGNGLAVGGLERNWVYFDKTGKIILRLPMEGHDRAPGFHEGLLLWKEGFYWGYKNASGEWALQPKYDEATDFNKGKAFVGLEGKRIAIDRTGTEIKKRKDFEQTGQFSDGLAMVNDQMRSGYTKTNGELAFPMRAYDEAFDFSCGRARIKLDGKFGFLDATGKLAIANQYDSATDFKDCLASVFTRAGFAYIDVNGKVVWQEKKGAGLQ